MRTESYFTDTILAYRGYCIKIVSSFLQNSFFCICQIIYALTNGADSQWQFWKTASQIFTWMGSSFSRRLLTRIWGLGIAGNIILEKYDFIKQFVSKQNISHVKDVSCQNTLVYCATVSGNDEFRASIKLTTSTVTYSDGGITPHRTYAAYRIPAERPKGPWVVQGQCPESSQCCIQVGVPSQDPPLVRDTGENNNRKETD